MIEQDRNINAETVSTYLPSDPSETLPALVGGEQSEGMNERELLYKVLFDMKNDLNHLKGLVNELMKGGSVDQEIVEKIYKNEPSFTPIPQGSPIGTVSISMPEEPAAVEQEHSVVEENLSLEEKEKELISKALKKHNNRRKNAAKELGISERTLYRKIKEYDL